MCPPEVINKLTLKRASKKVSIEYLAKKGPSLSVTKAKKFILFLISAGSYFDVVVRLKFG